MAYMLSKSISSRVSGPLKVSRFLMLVPSRAQLHFCWLVTRTIVLSLQSQGFSSGTQSWTFSSANSACVALAECSVEEHGWADCSQAGADRSWASADPSASGADPSWAATDPRASGADPSWAAADHSWAPAAGAPLDSDLGPDPGTFSSENSTSCSLCCRLSSHRASRVTRHICRTFDHPFSLHVS